MKNFSFEGCFLLDVLIQFCLLDWEMKNQNKFSWAQIIKGKNKIGAYTAQANNKEQAESV